MRKKIVKITFVVIILSIVLLFIDHFKRDIFNYPIEDYILESVLESDTTCLGKEYSRYSIVLLSNAPYLEKNIKRRLEETFWKYVTLDTLRYYTEYTMAFYRETKYLTRNFKEGNQYVPFYSNWDNTMDWRNHFKDRLGYIKLFKRSDETVFYTSVINDTGYGFKMFIDIVKTNRSSKNFSDIEHIYVEKCKEFGINKKDEKY